MAGAGMFSIALLQVRLDADPALLPALSEFYACTLELPLVPSRSGTVAIEVGETTLEFRGGKDDPFCHFAFLVPGNRFDAAHRDPRPRGRRRGATCLPPLLGRRRAVLRPDPASLGPGGASRYDARRVRRNRWAKLIDHPMPSVRRTNSRGSSGRQMLRV
jgi:hypothetical protein